MGAGDSKLEFKSRINTLEKQVIKPTDHKFWSVLFISPLSVQDIFALITPEDVRGLRSAQPENLATLIFKSIEQLHLFSLPRNIAAECTSARNSLFLLSRILPFVFEHDDDNFVQLLFFDNRIPKKIPGEWIDQMKKYSETYGLMKDKRFEQLLVQQEAQIKEQQQQQLKKKQQEEEEEAEKQRLKLIKEQEAAAQKKKQEEEERLAEEQRKKLAAEEEEKKKQQQQLLLQQQQQQKSAGKKGKKNKKNNKGTTVAAPVATTTPATSTSAVPNVEEEAKKEIPVESSEISTEPTPSEQSAEENTAEASKNQSEEAVEQATNVTESADEKQEATSSSSEFDFEEYKKTLIQVVNIGDKPLNETLAHVMIDTLMRSMFIPQFTVPVFQLKSEEPMKPNVLNTEFLWHAGVGMLNTNYAPTSEQMNNRYDVLRCLLACFSQVLYLRVDQCVTVENKFLSVAVSSQMPFITDVVYSLLNTVLKYDPRGSLPYTTQLMTDYDEKVVELSLNMLTLLLHHNPADAEHGNKARQVLESIEQDDDLSYMYNGFARNLNNLVDAHNTYLPGSQRLIPFYEELLVCFWKVLQTNKNFRIFICRDGDISRFIIPLLFLLQTEGKDATKFPLVQMTSFILLLLSGHREFSVALNRPIDIKIPLEVQVQGSFSDLLIVALCKCITSDKGIMKPLFDCLLTVIANISPYVKSMSMIASLKLVNLFEALAAPKYLYTSEKNCHYISLLLETFNNIIQYQYEGNPHIIYSIMRRANVFHELSKKPDLEKISQFIVEREKKREFPLPEHLLFMPTQQWVDSWKPRLPLTTVLTMINILNPEVERLCSRQMATEDDVLNHIKKSTLVGLLPVPHTIIVRTFVTSERIDTYLLTYCWGLIYLKHTDMFSAKHIKLFSVNVDSL